MKPIDEAENIRGLLKEGAMMTHEKKMNLIAQIQKNAIRDIVEIRPETITEGHDLNLPYQAYHFIGELRKEAIPPELAAFLDLLEACTRSMDNGQVLASAICFAYAKTDGGLISGHKYKKSQSDKAKLPRGNILDDDGSKTTIGEIIGLLATSFEHNEEGAKELWMLFYSELEGRYHLDPEMVDHPHGQKKSHIEYGNDNSGRKKITFGQFANTVADYRTGKNQVSRAINMP